MREFKGTLRSCAVACASLFPGALPPAGDAPPESAAAPAAEPLCRVDRRANEHQSSTQEATVLAPTPEGGFIVAWHSRRQQQGGTYGVYARRFAADGGAEGGEVQINANTLGSQTRPAVDVAPDGSVWFAWESFGSDGDLGSIVARRFAPDLAGATAEVLVNPVAVGHQAQPVIAAGADGGAWVAWTHKDPETGRGQVLLQGLGATGERRGSAQAVDAPEEASDGYPALARSGDELVCVFARAALDGQPSGILGRRFSSEGAPRGAVFAVSAQPSHAIEPSLAVAAEGDFAIAWLEAAGEDYAVRWRAFAGGAEEPIPGPIAALAVEGPGYTSGLEIARTQAGTALVWSRFGDGEHKADLWAQRCAADGSPLGTPFLVTAGGEGAQRLCPGTGARRAWLGPEGEIAVAWSGRVEGDESGAALSVAGSALAASAERLAAGEPAELAEPEWSPLEQGARPHDPPIRSSGRVPDLFEPQAATPAGAGGFQGFAETGLTPPDPEIAVGPDHVVVVVNDGIRFYTKAGALTFVDTISSPGFFAGSGAPNGFVFDPETLYDPHADRFMVMANSRAAGGSWFLLAVSDDTDPNGTWFKYAFNVTALAGNDIDSPNFAVDESFVYLTADFFTPSTKFLIFVVQKAPLLSGGAPATGSTLITGFQSMGVPITYDAGAPAQYIIESFESLSNSSVRFRALTGGTTPVMQSVIVNVPIYTFPEDPPQMGTSVRPELFEPRFWSCAYVNGSLWATHHQGTPVRQRWYEFEMNGWPTSGFLPTLAQTGEIVPGVGVRTFFGSIAVGSANEVALTLSRSSPTEFISMQTTTRKPTDPDGFTEPVSLAQASTSPDFTGRWGDYSGAEPDLTRNGIFWTHGEFRTNVWRTWIQPVDAGTAPEVYCTPKLSSIGCAALIATSDLAVQPVSGANDYSVLAEFVHGQKNGLVFGGISGPAALPFFGGTLCVNPPTQRGPLSNSGGSGPLACDGSYALLVNTGMGFPGGLDPGAGNSAWYQWWYRDPDNGAGNFGTALSNAVRLDFQ